ncbi:hypothetical protein [Plantactinospora sp. B5E13]|uniref:hypothetical protein n=1 Tax=unclassified Plantactinospora TaxID=2631981 RepID=UPI00325D88E4
MIGVLAAVLAVFPLLAAGGLVANEIKNRRIQISNDAFIPLAWHNLRADEIFPDVLNEPSTLGQHSRGWVRQGVAEESDCTEALVAKLAEIAVREGCTTALRATYVDTGGEAAATIALCVVGSNDQVATITGAGFSVVADRPGPMVIPVAVPKTAAAGWQKKLGYGGGTEGASPFGPYLAAITVGPADPNRRYGKLPADWKHTGEQELRVYQILARDLLGAYSRTFDNTVKGQ